MAVAVLGGGEGLGVGMRGEAVVGVCHFWGVVLRCRSCQWVAQALITVSGDL